MSIFDSIQYLKGVGPKRLELFNRLDIMTVRDLLYYFPHRFEDRTKLSNIKDIIEGYVFTLKVTIIVIKPKNFFQKGPDIINIKVVDESGELDCIWFNQPYLRNVFKVGTKLIIYGRITKFRNKLQMNQPEYEIFDEAMDDSLSIGRIVPVYSLTQGFTQKYIRKEIKNCLTQYLPQIKDILPYDIRKKHNLINIALALKSMHFPDSLDLLSEGKRRIIFEEFFLFEMMLLLRKLKKKSIKGISFKKDMQVTLEFINGLEFKLTESQTKALDEIVKDMEKPFMMYRLLQGDVGCGKTIVALICALIVVKNGYQVAFMVPTEILARQHYESIKTFLAGYKLQAAGYRLQAKEMKIGLLTSSLNKKEKDKILLDIKNGDLDIIVGTHALIEPGLQFKNLGLVVIDEQHKFGVGQRALLPKKGLTPDILVMTATPIPRTLAMTIYGDLDITTITQMPEGRIPVITQIFTYEKREDVFTLVRDRLSGGEQAYIVYPIIEESEELDLLSAQEMYQYLKDDVFKDFKVGLIHGRLKDKDQEKIMLKFKEHKIDILVATSVLEVGIDVANATIMVVEHADRFGLSQLHQLRGRIGRGHKQSFCMLIASPKTEEAQMRLTAMSETNDGFKIAEADLEIRGPGEIFGRNQHGELSFLVADLRNNLGLLKLARNEAMDTLKKDITLSQKQNVLIKEELQSRYPVEVLEQVD